MIIVMSSNLIFFSLHRCDTCAVCNSWNYQIAKQLQHDYDDAFKALEEMCPTFWKAKRKPCVASDDVPNGFALDQFLQLLDEHAVSCGADCEAHHACDFFKHEFQDKWKEAVEVFDFHFALKKQVRDAFQAQLDNPSPGFTYVVMDFQELGTLPIGPNEVGDLRYANNRLGYTTFSAMVWEEAFRGRRHIFTYISRVVERTTTFTVALLQDLVKRLDLSTTTHIGWWSDVGVHFRAYKVFGLLSPAFFDFLFLLFFSLSLLAVLLSLLL